MAKRRLTPQAPSNLADLLAAEERVKDFIAGNSGGTGPLTDAVRTGAQRTCDAVSAAPSAIADAASMVSVARLCRTYWQKEGYSEPVSDIPFPGGQCEGVGYQYVANFIEYDNNGQPIGAATQFSGSFLAGPITEVRMIPGPELSGSPGIADGYTFRLVNAAGQVRNVSNARNYLPGSESFSVSASSAPDTCGDPPEAFEPGANPAPNPGPEFQPTFPDGPNTPFFEIPDTYDDPITGPAPVPGDEAQGGGDGGLSTPIADLPKTEGPPTTGDSSTDGDVDFGEPPSGEVWIGFHLRVFTTQPFQPPIPGSEANKAYPRPLGNAAIKIQGESGPRASLQEVVRAERGTYVVPDYGLQVAGAYVNVIAGFQYEVIPLSVKVSDPLEV